MTYSRTVSMRNHDDAGQEISALADRVAPAVDITNAGATAKEITYRISGDKIDVDAVYAAGQRERLW